MNTKDWRHKPHNIDLTEVGKVLDSEPVAVLNSNQLSIPDNQHKNRAMEDWAVAVLEKQGSLAQCPVLGAVLLNRRSVKDSLGHGKKPSNEKLMAFYCLKQVIEQGVLIAENFALPNESGHWKSATVLIDNVEHIVTVLIRNDANCQRMYLHSVIQKQLLALDYAETENLKKSEQRFGSQRQQFAVNLPQQANKVKRISRNHPNGLMSSDIRQILQQALALCRKQSITLPESTP